MKIRMAISLALLLLLSLAKSYCQEENSDPIATDRPSFGTGAFVLPQAVFQIETGFQFTSTNSNLHGNVAPGLKFEVINFNSTVLRYGIGNGIELRFTQNLNRSRFRLDGNTTSKSDLELSPTAIGAKINIIEDLERLPDISFLANVGGQVFSDNGSGSYLDAAILLSGILFDEFGIDLNFGTVWLNGLSTLSYQYAIGLARSINQRLGFYVESYGIIPEERRLEEHNLNGGINYLLDNDVQLDIYGGTGFSLFSPNFFFGFGFSKRL